MCENVFVLEMIQFIQTTVYVCMCVCRIYIYKFTHHRKHQATLVIKGKFKQSPSEHWALHRIDMKAG